MDSLVLMQQPVYHKLGLPTAAAADDDGEIGFLLLMWIIIVGVFIMDSSMTASMVAFATSIDGIPLPEFVSLDDEYKCIHCHRILNVPRQLPCGHRICKLCVDELFEAARQRGRDAIRCPSSDVDCSSDVKVEQVHPDYSAQREMRRFPVYCMFKMHGCSQTMPWAKYKSHIEQCVYRLQRCKFCREEISLFHMQSHIDVDCLSAPCPCPYNCQQMIVRSELPGHMERCPCRPRPCQLRNVGCSFEGTEAETESHQDSSHWHHLLLIATVLCQRPTERSDSAAAAASVATSSHLEDVKQFCEVRLTEFRQQLTGIENRLRDAVMSGTNHKLGAQDNSAFHPSSISTSPPSELSVLVLTEEVERVQREKDAVITQLQQQVNDLDLRCRFLETAGYDGSVLWKIGNVSQRISDARDGTTISLYSQPFYAGRYGYKLCARVYFNGDGNGRGSHVSLFFVVMQGDYDDILLWPFTARVTMTLLDQSPGRRHRSESFRPDERSSSFQKPQTSTNVASGIPQFISHKDLLEVGPDGQTFVKNDTVYFRVSVNMSDIA